MLCQLLKESVWCHHKGKWRNLLHISSHLHVSFLFALSISGQPSFLQSLDHILFSFFVWRFKLLGSWLWGLWLFLESFAWSSNICSALFFPFLFLDFSYIFVTFFDITQQILDALFCFFVCPLFFSFCFNLDNFCWPNFNFTDFFFSYVKFPETFLKDFLCFFNIFSTLWPLALLSFETGQGVVGHVEWGASTPYFPGLCFRQAYVPGSWNQNS